MECLVSKLILSLAMAFSMGTTGAYQIAKPGCQDECGGVKIPFPFGIEPGCYYANITSPINTTYRITCNHTTNPPLPFLDKQLFSNRISSINDVNLKVLSISLEEQILRLPSRIAYECYTFDPKRRMSFPTTTDNNKFNLGYLWPYTVSGTRNRFVAVGCDTTAQVYEDEMVGLRCNVAGCVTSCTDLKDVKNGTCSSNGCCETSVCDTMTDPWIEVGSSKNHSDVSQFNPCRYAFVGEVGSYSFSTSNLTATATDLDELSMQLPVVYDWSIQGFGNCSEAKKSGDGNFLCGSNTRCVDVVSINPGYSCQCLKGYTGNPYLQHGCQDINECLDKGVNDCEKQEYCVNKDGGYECECPKGHQGKATQTSPCIPVPGAAKLILGLGIGMGSMLGFILLYILYKLLRRRKEIQDRQQNFKRNGGLLLHQEMSTNEGVIDRTKIFRQIELERATDNFNENRVLGRGGQGTVYKGMLEDGAIVAVKKSKKVDENQLGQFINEVVILSQINHRNIVKIFGCCLETEVPLLVYEFVPNSTLYHHIHHPDEDFRMTWKVRFQIGVECAGAIAYLHSSCSSPIYHRDIKSSNILLDEKYKAKIADFGTSKTISIDKTHVTTCVQGTFGYLDPEFFRSGHFNEKSDVYSFGVVLLELLTSKKPIFTDTTSSDQPRGLATEFVQLMETSPNELHGMLDKHVLQHCSEEEIEALAMLIKRCLCLNGKQRPTMKEVAVTLEMIKAQYEEEGNAAIDEQEIGREDGRVWIDEGRFNTSTTFAFSTETSCSMDAEPLLFDSNFEA